MHKENQLMRSSLAYHETPAVVVTLASSIWFYFLSIYSVCLRNKLLMFF